MQFKDDAEIRREERNETFRRLCMAHLKAGQPSRMHMAPETATNLLRLSDIVIGRKIWGAEIYIDHAIPVGQIRFRHGETGFLRETFAI